MEETEVKREVQGNGRWQGVVGWQVGLLSQWRSNRYTGVDGVGDGVF